MDMATGGQGPGARFGSTGEAVRVMEDAARYLAGVSYPGLPAEAMAGVLAGMERVDAVQAAVRGRAGNAFIAAQAHLDWGHKSLSTWYRHQSRVTGAAARANKGWARRGEQHPAVLAALAEGDVISESWARRIMGWTDRLPDEFAGLADQILVEAARNGVDEAGLARLAYEIGARTLGPDAGDGKEPGPGVSLKLTFEGAGLLEGDLSPECAAKVKAVLEPLAAAVSDPGRDLSWREKMHMALEEAMTRLLAARLVPQSQGAPSTAIAHIHFADLVAMDQDSVLLDRWAQDIAAWCAAERAGARVQPGDGGAWLSGDAARRFAADAMIVPVVTATLDPSHLGRLIELCLDYHHAAQDPPAQDPPAQDPAGAGEPAAGTDAGPVPDLDELIRQILGVVVAIASGAASYLRRNQLGQIGLGGPSLPLDVGRTDRIPPQIRRAVSIRDHGTCAFPGGCSAPAIFCDQHHCVHRADGGITATGNIAIFCQFHHDTLLHKYGWSAAVEPDGTITIRKPDGTIFLRSHPPWPRPG
jgi:hypothetical protein